MLIHLSITSGVQYLESVPVVHTDKNHHYYKQTFACTANPIVSKFTFRGNISKVLKPGSGSGLFDKKNKSFINVFQARPDHGANKLPHTDISNSKSLELCK